MVINADPSNSLGASSPAPAHNPEKDTELQGVGRSKETCVPAFV